MRFVLIATTMLVACLAPPARGAGDFHGAGSAFALPIVVAMPDSEVMAPELEALLASSAPPPERSFVARLGTELLLGSLVGAICATPAFLPEGATIMGWANATGMWIALPLGADQAGRPAVNPTAGFTAMLVTVAALSAWNFSVAESPPPAGELYLVNASGIALAEVLMMGFGGALGRFAP